MNWSSGIPANCRAPDNIVILYNYRPYLLLKNDRLGCDAIEMHAQIHRKTCRTNEIMLHVPVLLLQAADVGNGDERSLFKGQLFS